MYLRTRELQLWALSMRRCFGLMKLMSYPNSGLRTSPWRGSLHKMLLFGQEGDVRTIRVKPQYSRTARRCLFVPYEVRTQHFDLYQTANRAITWQTLPSTMTRTFRVHQTAS